MPVRDSELVNNNDRETFGNLIYIDKEHTIKITIRKTKLSENKSNFRIKVESVQDGAKKYLP